ncbi:MAG TPA: DUF5985 family protein [Steroidobacteraceae bacterium]|nr:DUF5985 family protein [Steroidobacteraceae bacterium]
MTVGFLLGVIVTASLVAGAYFYKFWRQTRDPLFLGFAAAFLIEGINRTCFLFVASPESGSVILYSVRLVSYLLILLAIAHKNRT